MAGGRFSRPFLARPIIFVPQVLLRSAVVWVPRSCFLPLSLLLTGQAFDVGAQQRIAETPKASVDPLVQAAASKPSPALPKLPIVQKPAPLQPVIDAASDPHLDKTPPRQTKGLDLIKMGWSYNCMECHKLLEAKWHRDRPMVEHENINLRHGNNRFCLNCHHPTNRNAFVDYDGAEIAEADVVLLCAKCHGPTFRDWEAGVHGRRNGFWNAKKGPRTQLRCIQCHDPHEPTFQPMNALPPPHYPSRAPQPSDHESQLVKDKQP